MEDKVRILLVEDFAPDAELEKIEIRQEIPNSEFLLVDTKSKFLAALEQFDPHVIVSDYMMPQFDGMTALKLTLEKTNLIPFILCTGSMNEDTAVECMKMGVTDYIIKEHMKRLGKSIKNALNQREILIQKKETEEKANQYANDQAILLETTTKILVSTDLQEIYEIVFHAIDQLVPDSYLILASCNQKDQINKLEFHRGFDRYLKWLDKIFHITPKTLTVPMANQSEEEIARYCSGKLLREPGGLFGLSIRSIPREICKLIEKALKVKEVYSIGFPSTEQQFGDLSLLQKEVGYPKKAELIEVIMSEASQMIQKYYSKKDLLQNQDQMQSLLNISQLRIKSIQELLDFALDEVVKITNSQFGFIYLYQKDNKELTLQAWSKEAITNPPEKIGPLENEGIWEETIRQRKPIINNEYKAPPSKGREYPKNQTEIKRFLTIPVFFDGLIVAAVGVVNKENDYTLSDIDQLTLMMDSVWKIKHQKESNLALYESNERFRIILNYSPIGIATIDKNGFLNGSNNCFKDIFCIPPSIEPTYFNIFNSDIASLHGREALLKGKLISIEKEFTIEQLESIFQCKMNRSGKIDLEITIKSIETNSNSSQITFILQVQDITERKSFENTKNEFINLVSHEMRTPFTAIQQSMAIMKELSQENLSGEQNNLLEISLRNINRLGKLIQEILDFQKLNTVLMEFNIKPDSINDLIQQINQELTTFSSKKDLKIQVELTDNLPNVMMDRERIPQVLMNLINNAIKFTEKGSITIKTELEEQINRCKVSVIDTGIGMKQNDIRKLFFTFFQVKKEMEHQTGTCGLGLPICKKILEGHHSNLFVTSKPGKGSTFFFYLPLAAGRG